MQLTDPARSQTLMSWPSPSVFGESPPLRDVAFGQDGEVLQLREVGDTTRLELQESAGYSRTTSSEDRCPSTERIQACARRQCYVTPPVTNAPHDALFKTIFGQPEHAAAELQHILPGHIAARIDWSSLTPQPGTYVDEELADQHSDLLFSAATRPSHEPVLV